MGLRQRVASWALLRPHALLVEVPGWWSTRVDAERELLRRGWTLAMSPADADVLVVCGEPGASLTQRVEQVWDQFPGPRARLTLAREDPSRLFDEAAAQLADDDLQRTDARRRLEPPHGDGDGDHGDMDHGDMDHGDMDMAPEGIPLAGGGQDRDGLEMDVLNVPLGPVLPCWPPGLVLRCVVQGDVVTEAGVEVLEGHLPPHSSTVVGRELRAARACDAAARLLALAGSDASADARRVRDLLLDGDREQAKVRLDRLRARVTHSWSLRWMLRGLGTLGDDDVAEYGLSVDARGDVHDRLAAMLARTDAELDGLAGRPSEAGAVLQAMTRLVTGLELAAVRLVVASLAPDTTASSQGVHVHE